MSKNEAALDKYHLKRDCYARSDLEWNFFGGIGVDIVSAFQQDEAIYIHVDTGLGIAVLVNPCAWA